MALVDLNSIQFYQPPVKASLLRETAPKASDAVGSSVVGKRKPSKAPGPSGGWSATPWGDDPIEFIDMTDPPARGNSSQFCELTPDLREIEVDARDTTNERCNTGDFDHSVSEGYDLPTFEELLLSTGEIHKPDGTGSGGTFKEGLLEHTTREDCDIDYFEGDDLDSDPNSAPASAKRDVFSVSDSSRHTSDGSTADKEDKELDTPYTQTCSVASSEDSSSNLREINTHSVSRTSPPYCNDSSLSPSLGKQVCKINNSFKHHEPGLLNCDDRRVQYDNNKAEGNNKKANNSGSNSRKKNTPRPIRKRRPTAVKKASPQRATKRHRFSSPLISDETEETGDDSDVSSYAPTKPYRAISPRSIGLWGSISDHKELKIGGQSKWPRASQTAVIYEQQGWEGEIVDERDVKQGPGRPRKQYLVRWKPSWVDGGRLTMSEVVQNWKEKKTSRCRH